VIFNWLKYNLLKSWKALPKKIKIIAIVFTLTLFNLAGLYLIYIPSDNKIKGCLTTSMFAVDLCPASKDYVPLKQISPFMQKAIVATEDADFYTHAGFDTDGIQHCFEKLREKHRIVCGGSTISQQLAKNMFLSKNKSFIRKGLEAIITVKIENLLNKREILERYLNVVQFGKNIFGIKKAAQYYFKKSPASLSILESSFLAMVLPNPEKYSMSYYKKDLSKFASKRLKGILRDLRKAGSISQFQYESSLNELDYFLRPPAPPADINSEFGLDNLEMTKDEIEEFEKELSQDEEN
jgi:monofunctional glycosyltransferase